jgi:hypothetical protein
MLDTSWPSPSDLSVTHYKRPYQPTLTSPVLRDVKGPEQKISFTNRTGLESFWTGVSWKWTKRPNKKARLKTGFNHPTIAVCNRSYE